MIERLKENLAKRPHWINAVMLFCFYMTFIYLPWDIFIKDLAFDQEVWFGILFYGWLAKIGALLHWFIYSAGAYGLWKMKKWLHPWIELYVLQVAFSMGIWGFIARDGAPAWTGLVISALFVFMAWRFYQKRDLFSAD